MTLCKLQKEPSCDWKSNLLAWLHGEPASWPRLSRHVTCYQCVIKPPQPDIRLTRKALKGRADCSCPALSLSAIIHSSGGISSISAACRQHTHSHTQGDLCNYFHILSHPMMHSELNKRGPSSVLCFVLISSWRPSGCCLTTQSLYCFNLDWVPDYPWALRGRQLK